MLRTARRWAWGPCLLVTYGCAVVTDLSDLSSDAGSTDASSDAASQEGGGICTPGTTMACGSSGTTTCNSAGYWCNCLGDTPATCVGTGTFVGCRGDGCYVCEEKVSAYACYAKNHPTCAVNTTCAGQFFTCSAQCPAPTSEDACNCVAADGGWPECGNTPCTVCTDQTSAYACYFINHPTCLPQNNCATRGACSQFCPAPVAADKGFTADGGPAP
jgi:hypothetical protein